MIETPCTGVCALDPATGMCLGCLRTIDEIACWASLSTEERRAVMGELPDRTPPHLPAGGNSG